MQINDANLNNNFGPVNTRNNNSIGLSQRNGAQSRISKLQNALRGGQNRSEISYTTLAMGEEDGGAAKPFPTFPRPDNPISRPPTVGSRPIDGSKPLPFPNDYKFPKSNVEIDLDKFRQDIDVIRSPGIAMTKERIEVQERLHEIMRMEDPAESEAAFKKLLENTPKNLFDNYYS